ncbi:MAG: undecaprenyl-diphosphatase [Crocinitomicaceae bacterium]|jgi:undecaprenyl-diphosphatase
MIEWLESIDRAIVEAVNGCNSPFWDEFMWIVSAKLTWVPLYVALIYLAIRQNGWKIGVIFFLGVVMAVGFADIISTQLFKELIQRYRPSHHALLTEKLHFYQIDAQNIYRGGQYGFVSSHAANTFAICVFSMLHLRSYKRWLYPILIGVALLISYSRIYLGVHYLSDVFVGALLGTAIAWTIYRFVFLTIVKKLDRK